MLFLAQVVRFWFDEKTAAWMVGFVLDPTATDLTRGLLSSGYYELSLTHQRDWTHDSASTLMRPLAVTLTVLGFRGGSNITRVLTQEQYESEVWDTMAENETTTEQQPPATAPPPAGSDTGIFRSLADGIGEISDEPTRTRAMNAMVQLETSVETGLQAHQDLAQQLADSEEQRKALHESIKSLQGVHTHNVKDLVRNLTELAAIVKPGASAEQESFGGSAYTDAFAAHPELVAPLYGVVQASLCRIKETQKRPRPDDEEENENRSDRYNRIDKALRMYGTRATQGAIRHGTTQASVAENKKRRRKDDEPPPHPFLQLHREAMSLGAHRS